MIVGGSGALVDLANNSRIHDLVLGFAKLNKPIAAECYGVSCMAFARDIREKRGLIEGRRVTGHPLDYDYLDGTGFEGPHFTDGTKKGFGEGYVNFGAPFYPLEHILRDAVGPNGQFIGNVIAKTSVIVDYPFITSRSTASSCECGRVLVDVLERGHQALRLVVIKNSTRRGTLRGAPGVHHAGMENTEVLLRLNRGVQSADRRREDRRDKQARDIM